MTKTIRTSPWGEVQHAESFGEGVTLVETAGHGGFRVDPVARLQMPPAFRRFRPFAGTGWYEEDCDQVIVIAAFPDRFPPSYVAAALAGLKRNKSYYEECGANVDAFFASRFAEAAKTRAAAAA